jgi:hypothetical protein
MEPEREADDHGGAAGGPTLQIRPPHLASVHSVALIPE